jgi:hypothetical protein
VAPGEREMERPLGGRAAMASDARSQLR